MGEYEAWDIIAVSSQSSIIAPFKRHNDLGELSPRTVHSHKLGKTELCNIPWRCSKSKINKFIYLFYEGHAVPGSNSE